MKKTFTLFAAVLLTATVWAQTPQSFKYQAVARDAGGDVVANQALGMQISILQGSTSGTAVYVETFLPTTNEFGLINLNIGAGTVVSGDFTTIDWSADTYFMKIEMDMTGGTTYEEYGTSQLLSVPYAFHANTVENESQVLELDGSELSISGGNSINLRNTSLNGFIEDFDITTTITIGGIVPERIFLEIIAEFEYYAYQEDEWHSYSESCIAKWIDNDQDGYGNVMIIPGDSEEFSPYFGNTSLVGRIYTREDDENNNPVYIDFNVSISGSSITISRTSPSFSDYILKSISIFYNIF